MDTIKGKVKCMVCKESIEIKFSTVYEIFSDCVIDNDINVICDDCIDFVMSKEVGKC